MFAREAGQLLPAQQVDRGADSGKSLSVESLLKIEAWFGECPGALVAFSGGVDSSLVAFLARHFLGRERSCAVISASASLKLSDLEEAKTFARNHDLPLRIITTDEITNPDYFTNPSNRCYYCKHTLYDELNGLRGEKPEWWVLNGTNVDDLGDYRPGLVAAHEFFVRSPLADCGLSKADVRELAAHFSLECWDKPASPCLSSRVPYGEEITVKKLRQIEEAEAALKAAGFPISRVRHFGTKARIEVPKECIQRLEEARKEIEKAIRVLEFQEVEFDEEGFVSGKLNRALARGQG
jgi:pyridinium-3,5-biscarboxylic acid mononucleotide sulfurtransferase